MLQKDKNLVALLTRTPYMITSHRLLVTGERVELPQKIQKKARIISRWDHFISLLNEYIWLSVIILLMSIVLIIRFFLKPYQKK